MFIGVLKLSHKILETKKDLAVEEVFTRLNIY